MDENSYQISVSWHEDILMIAVTGQASEQNAHEIAQDAIKILSEHKPSKVLIDCTKIIGRLSITDTYYHVRQYPTKRHRPMKLAVLDISENRDYFEFHEATAVNAGFPIKYFTDIDNALKWLR